MNARDCFFVYCQLNLRGLETLRRGEDVKIFESGREKMGWKEEKEQLFWEKQRGIWGQDSFGPCSVDSLSLVMQRLREHRKSSCDEVVDFSSSFSVDTSNQALAFRYRYTRALQLISGKKVAVVLLAAGQSTRLGLQGSKGLFPASSVNKATLFALFSQRLAFLENYLQASIPLAVLCQDPQEIKGYFEENGYFGLHPSRVDFFAQSEMPLLTEEVRAVVKSDGNTLLKGPDGNGGVFEALMRSGIWSRWEKSGIQVLATSLIDNPLMAPFALPALEYFAKVMDSGRKTSCLLCAVACKDPSEKVGLIGKGPQGHLRIVEYGEHGQEAEKDSFFAANSGAMIWSFPSLNKTLKRVFPSLNQNDEKSLGHLSARILPIHIAKKRYKVEIGEPGRLTWQDASLLKLETFIFDWLQIVQELEEPAQALVIDKMQYFYPLKNKQGHNSPVSFAKHLSDRARDRLQELGVHQIHGIDLKDLVLEISPSIQWLQRDELSDWIQRTTGMDFLLEANLRLSREELAKAGVFFKPIQEKGK